LNLSAAVETLRKHSDPTFGGFVGYNSTELLARECWKEFIVSLFTTVTPISTSISAASELFYSSSEGMSNPITGPAIFISAFNSAIALIGQGMLPSYNSTPPVYSLITDFGNPTLNAPGVTPLTAANTIGSQLFTRATTGIAVLSVPPFTSVQWS